MIVYLGMLGIILTSAVLFAAEFAGMHSKSTAVIEASRNARFAAARVAQEVREAGSINVGASTFGSNPSTLSLQTDDAGTDPTIITVTGGALTIEQGSGPILPLTSSKTYVTDFTVENLSSGSKTKAVRISVTVAYLNPSELGEIMATSTIETTAKVRKADGFAP